MAGNAAASQTPRHVNGDGRGNFKDAHAADRRKHFLTILRFPLPQASAGGQGAYGSKTVSTIFRAPSH
jgi:hypothetical protein